MPTTAPHPRLRRVYWIGGAACGGKTTVAAALNERLGWPIYGCDEAFERHRRRVDPARHPRFAAIMDKDPAALFAPPALEQLAEHEGFYREQFPMIVDDLLRRDADRPLLVEGAGLLPDLVAPLLAEPRRAIFLVPTPEVRARSASLGHPEVKALLAGAADREEAHRRWMERDRLYGERLAALARARGLAVLTRDGARSIAETADLVAERLGLGPPLTPARPNAR